MPHGPWNLSPAVYHEPDAPDELTDAELAEVQKVFAPLTDLLQTYIDANPETWTFDAMHEALARAHDYLDGMERYIEQQIAIEEADA